MNPHRCCFWGEGVPNHKVRACFYRSHSPSKCKMKICITCFLQSKPNPHQVDHLLSPTPTYFFSIYSETRDNERGGDWGPAGHSEMQSSTPHLQAVYNSAAFSTVVFLLPLVHLADELQEGALGHWRVSVHRPAQELELLHHPISVLGLDSQAVIREWKENRHYLLYWIPTGWSHLLDLLIKAGQY